MRKAGLNPMIASAALVVACMVSGPTAHAYAAPVPEAAASEAPQTKAGIITGKVMDEEGEPLPGASIKVKGLKLGTTTDADGMFTLTLGTNDPSGEYTLIVTYVGMKDVEIKVRSNAPKPVKIEMVPNSEVLDDVLVVGNGYNTLPRKDMVGAFTTVKAEDVMMPAYQSIDQMLQGKVAGMIVQNSSARIGSRPSITIRGTSTLLGNTEPLWVVDGVIQSDPLSIDVSSALTEDMSNLIGNQISWLNPQDIETITVLKDASATAIYGSKASNGVIVITTKKGSADRTSVRYTGNLSIRQRPNYGMFNYMNSLERIQFSKEAYEAGARYQSEPLPQVYTYEGLMAMVNNNMISEADFKTRLQFLETCNTDWFKLLTRNSISHNHNVSVSGGTQKVTYNASVGYSSNKGTEIGNDQDQLTSRLQVNAQLSNRLRIVFTAGGSISNANSFGPNVSPESYAQTTSRTVPAFDMDGSPVYYKNYYTYRYNRRDINTLQYGYNIFNEIENSYSKSRGTNYNVTFNLDLKILEGLNYQLVGNITQTDNSTEVYQGEKSSYIEQNFRGYPARGEAANSEKFNAAMLPFGGILTTNDSRTTSYDMQHKLVFSKTFNEIHRINAMAAFQMRSIKSNSNGNTVWGYVPERGEMIVSPNYPEKIQPIGGTEFITWGALTSLYDAGAWHKTSLTSNYLSYFATLAYSLNNTYVLNFNVRQDASNRFGQDSRHKFNPTYSAGLSLRLGELGFVHDAMPWLNQLNVRGTYGVQGNVVQSISPELIAHYNGILSGYNEYTVSISSLPNPMLKWESTRTWNLGLDLQLLNGIQMNLEYYGRRSNALISQSIPEEYGMLRMRLNGGRILNHGLEFSFNYTPFRSKNFAWTIGLNASKNWNKSGNPDSAIRANGLGKGDFLSGRTDILLKKGYPISSFWSYSFAGLDPETGYPLFNGIDFTGEGDPNIDPTTFLVYSGQSKAYFTGGFNTRVRWKDLSFGADFSALLGAKKRLPNPYSGFSNGKMPSPISNLNKDLKNRWKKPGDELHTNIPALYTSVVSNDINLPIPDGSVSSRYDTWAMSDALVADGSFLRCTQINLTYYLPKRICGKFGASSLSLSANLNNVFVIASKRWNGFDPELRSSVMPRIYSFGLSVSF